MIGFLLSSPCALSRSGLKKLQSSLLAFLTMSFDNRKAIRIAIKVLDRAINAPRPALVDGPKRAGFFAPCGARGERGTIVRSFPFASRRIRVDAEEPRKS
jgi:hypothetical protein